MGCGGFEVWVISLGMGVDEFFFFYFRGWVFYEVLLFGIDL